VSETDGHDGADAPTSNEVSFTPSSDAPQMADALRASLAVRRRLAAEGEGDAGARLRELGDLEGLPAVAKPGAAAPAVRFARKVLQAFMRPWLAAQTIFNREAARRFQSMLTAVQDLERRTPHLESGIRHLEDRILTLERRLDPEPGQPPAPRLEVGTDGIERMFVHSRLPAPPARVLLLGPSAAAVGPELRSFGFDVAGADAESTAVAVAGPHPFSDAEFEVIVCLLASAPEVNQLQLSERLAVEASRLLRKDGRLLLTLRHTATAAASGEPAAAGTVKLGPLDLVELLLRADTSSTVKVIPHSRESGAPAVPAGTLLIDARRADVSPR
jgi:hypothetical protein